MLMHSIEIKNFGPISSVSMDITKMVFLLGELASGKSTIAKLVYYFRTWQEEFASIIANEFEDWRRCRNAYNSLLRNKFTNIFGSTINLGHFEITYRYAPDSYVTITPTANYKVDIDLGTLLPELKKIWLEAKKAHTGSRQNGIIRELRRRIQAIFHDDYYSIYIPAGRALLSRQMLLRMILSREANLINERILNYKPLDVVDVPTRRYMEEAEDARVWFSSTINDDSTPGFLVKTSEQILKGRYISRNDVDYIQLDGKQLIPLPYSSSGQQEVIWLLNIMLYYASIGQKCFIVIEEPEAHLHPDAQYLLVKYISAFRNITESEVLITTHSPYILSSCNNLFYAEKCGRDIDGKDSVHSVIPKECWASADDVSAYIMDKSVMKNIKDDKLAMIEIAELDKVASEQDDEYETLLRLSRGGEL